MPNDYTKPLRAAEILTAWYGLAVNLGTSSGSANALAGASADDTSNTFTTGRLYRIRTNNANSGAVTVAKNGGTGVAIRKSPSSAALVSGDLASGAELLLFYDGTYLQILAGLTVSATDSTKLPLAGGTMTGPVGFSGTQSSAGSTTTNLYRGSSGELFLNSAWLTWSWSGTNYHTFGATGWQLLSGTTGVGNGVTNIFRGANDELNLHGAGGCSVVSARLVARANSTAYGLCAAATGDVLRCLLQDDGNKRAVALVAANGTVTFEAGSHADYVASSSPASGEVGVYVSSSVLTIKPGSAGARSIAASADRARA